MEGLKDAGIQAYFLPVPFASIDLPIRRVAATFVEGEYRSMYLGRCLGAVNGYRASTCPATYPIQSGVYLKAGDDWRLTNFFQMYCCAAG